MDPLLVSSSIASLLENVHKVLGLTNVGHEDDSEIREVTVLDAIYRDIHFIVVSASAAPTFSINQALQQCQVTQEHLFELLDSIGYGRLKHSLRLWDRMKYAVSHFLNRSRLARAQQEYKDAVFFLKDVAMSSVDHQQVEKMKSEVERLRREASAIDINVSETDGVATRAGLPFDATIVLESDKSPRKVLARGLLDSGSDIDFISREFARRAGLLDLANDLDKPVEFKLLTGIRCTYQTTIDLKWYLNDDSFTHSTTFCLIEDESFDILLGKEFVSKLNHIRSTPKVRMASRAMRRAPDLARDLEIARTVFGAGDAAMPAELLALVNRERQDTSLAQGVHSGQRRSPTSAAQSTRTWSTGETTVGEGSQQQQQPHNPITRQGEQNFGSTQPNRTSTDSRSSYKHRVQPIHFGKISPQPQSNPDHETAAKGTNRHPVLKALVGKLAFQRTEHTA